MSIATPPEASRSITHFRCKKDFFYKIQYGVVEQRACIQKRRKSIFHNLFSPSMTWRSRGLLGVTGKYKRLQGVTRGCKGLQQVTRGYTLLQGVIRGDRGCQRGYRDLQRILETLFSLESSQILFLGLFCIIIKVEEVSNFRPKRKTNLFGKILIFRFW